MGQRMKVGVIGCGFFAGNHLNAWNDLGPSGADLTAVCDIDASRAQAAAKAFGIGSWYADPLVMMREAGLDLIDIVTGMNTHRALVGLAMDHAIPTIVQKPFGPDLDACRAMVQASEAAGTFLAVHENFRFQRPLRQVGDVVRSGVIGVPSWARISFRTGTDIYAGQPYLLDEERFVLLDLGVHLLDVARFLLGEVAHLSCETQRRNPRVRAEDTATMLLRHASGAVSVVDCTYESRRRPDLFPEVIVEIEGTRGAVALKPGYRMQVTSEGEMTTRAVDAPLRPWASRPWHVVQDSVHRTCAHMLDCVRTGRQAETSAEDSLRTFALVEAAYDAAATRRSGRPAA